MTEQQRQKLMELGVSVDTNPETPPASFNGTTESLSGFLPSQPENTNPNLPIGKFTQGNFGITPSNLLPDANSGGALFRSARRSTIPGLIGLATLRAAQAIPNPAAKIIASFVGPAITGAGAGVAQDSIVKSLVDDATYKQMEQQQAQDYQNNWLATKAGEILGSGALALRPGIKPLTGLGKDLAQSKIMPLISGGATRPLSDAAKQNAINILGGAGASTGVGAGVQYAMTGELPSTKDIIANLVGGAVMNTPTKTGQKYLGLHPNAATPHDIVAKSAKEMASEQPKIVTPKVDTAEPFAAKDIESANVEAERAIESANKLQEIKLQEEQKALEERIRVAALKKQNRELAQQAKELESRITPEGEEKYQAKIAAQDAQAQQAGVDIKKKVGPPVLSEPILAIGAPKGPNQPGDITEIATRYYPNPEHKPIGYVPQESATALPTTKSASPENIKVPDNFSEESAKLPTPLPKESKQQGTIRLNSESPTPEQLKLNAEEARLRFEEEQKLRLIPNSAKPSTEPVVQPRSSFVRLMNYVAGGKGAKYEQEVGMINPETGNEVSGQAPSAQEVNSAIDNAQQIVLKINPNKATESTYAHELFHPMQQFLARSPYKTDRVVLGKINDAVASSPEYAAWSKARNVERKQSTVDEFIATHAPADVMARLQNRQFGRDLLRDFWAHIKIRFNKANTSDLMRIMGSKQLYDAPGSYGNKINAEGKVITPGSRFSEDDNAIPDNVKATSAWRAYEVMRDQLPREVEAGAGKERIADLQQKISNAREIALRQGGDTRYAEEEMQGKKVRDSRFDAMFKEVENPTQPPPKAKQLELPLEGDAAKFAEMKRIAENPPRYSEEDISNVSKMSPDDFRAYTMNHPSGLTGAAKELGSNLTSKDSLALLQRAYTDASNKSEEYLNAGNMDDYIAEASKAQFFSEAYGRATKTGASDKEVSAPFEGEAPINRGENRYSEQTETPEFKKWFGDSKVVDSDGKPLVVYHGTKHSEGSFDKEMKWKKFDIDPISVFKAGHFGTSNQAEQHIYGSGIEDYSPAIYPVFLKASKIKRINDVQNNWGPTIEQAKNEGYDALVYKNKYEPDIPVDEIRRNWDKYSEEAQRKVPFEKLSEGARYARIFPRDQYWLGKRNKAISENKIADSYIVFSPNQVKSAIGNKGTFDPNNPDIRYSVGPDEKPTSPRSTPKLGFKYIQSVFDKIASEVKSDSGDYATDRLNTYAQEKTDNLGKYVNTPLHDISSFDDVQKQHVIDSLIQDDINAKIDNSRLTPDEQVLKQKVRDYLVGVREDQNAMGLKVSGRMGKFNETYFPSMLSTEAAYTLLQTPFSAKAKALRNTWQKYLIENGGLGGATAKQTVDDYLKGINAHDMNSAEFNALRKAEGFGLPAELRDNNLVSLITRYGRRVSKDFAYFKILQNDRAAQKILNLRGQEGQTIKADESVNLPDGTLAEDISASPSVQHALTYLKGIEGNLDSRAMAVMRVVHAGMLGPLTGVRNWITLPAVAAPYLKSGDFVSAAKAFARIKSDWVDAYKAGAFRKNPNEIEMGSSINPDRFIAAADAAAQWIRKWPSIGVIENASRVYTYSLGDMVATANFQRAAEGDNTAKSWLRKFGKTVDKLEDYIGKPASEVPKEVTSKIAKSFSELVQGTYDERGLPGAVINGQFASVFQLGRWSVERSNIVYKDAIVPAMNGDYKPLLKYTLGTFLAGTAIAAINELLTNRKQGTPTISEAIATNNKKELISAVIARMQLGSFMGLVGDLASMTTQVARGQTARLPVGSIPSVDYIKNSLAPVLSDIEKEIEKNGPSLNLALQAIDEIMAGYLQSYRMVKARTVDAKNRQDADYRRDLRVFMELVGERDIAKQIPMGSKIEDTVTKFKRTDDINEAAKLLPGVVEQTIREIKAPDGSVTEERAKKVLEGLRNITYQTFPDPKNRPELATRYMEYLDKTQGVGTGLSRYVDFMYRKAVNDKKKEMVGGQPSE